MACVDHPFIVGLKGAFQTDKTLFLVVSGSIIAFVCHTDLIKIHTCASTTHSSWASNAHFRRTKSWFLVVSGNIISFVAFSSGW